MLERAATGLAWGQCQAWVLEQKDRSVQGHSESTGSLWF